MISKFHTSQVFFQVKVTATTQYVDVGGLDKSEFNLLNSASMCIVDIIFRIL